MGEVFLHLLSLAQSASALGGLFLDAGPEGLQLVQPVSHRASSLRLLPAQSLALLTDPGHPLRDQDEVPLMENIKNKRAKQKP